jgi:hypothetical protein
LRPPTTAAQYSNVGSYGITQGTVALTTTASTLGYTIGYTPANLSITPRAVTVTADNGLTKIYGYSDPALSYAITSGNLVNGDGFTGGLSRIAGENVGSYALSAGTLSLEGNYTLSVNTIGKALAITPRPVTVTADSGLKKQIRQNDPALTYGITTGSLVSGDSFTGALSRAAGENVGAYALNSGTLSLSSNYVLSIDTMGKFFSIENDIVMPDSYLYVLNHTGERVKQLEQQNSKTAEDIIIPSIWTVENPVTVISVENDSKPVTLTAVTTLCSNPRDYPNIRCGAVSFKDSVAGK